MTTKEVRAFMCGACRRLRSTAKKADACCLCRCGARVARPYVSMCAACGWRNSVRCAKAEVKRYREILAARERRVAQLLADKPKAGKGGGLQVGEGR